MSSSSSPVLVLELQRLWLRLLPMMVLLVSGLLMPLLADLSWHATLIVWFVTFAAVAGSLYLSGYGRGCAISRIAWQQDLSWQLQTSDGETTHAVLLPRSWSTAWLMGLQLLTEQGRRISLLVWRPELSAAAWHQWQVRLRMEGMAAAGLPREPG